MVQLLTTGEAFSLFKERVTLKQMEDKHTQMVHDLLQTAESHGSALVLFIKDPKLNKRATALLGCWVPSELSPALIKMAGLIQSTVGFIQPTEPPTTEQMVKAIMEPIKQITDEFAQGNKEQAELDQMQAQDQEPKDPQQ